MNVTNTTSAALSTSFTLIDTTVYDTFLTINLLVVCYIVGVFGITANVINIINFKNQSFQDGVNVTLTALAVSDLGALLSLLTTNIVVNPWLLQVDMVIVKTHLFAIFFYIHEYFIRVGGLITSFAAFERCLCVVLPLKVKKIITKNVALNVNSAIFIVLSLYLFPPFNVIYFDSKFITEVNKTLFSMYFKSNRESYMSVYYFIADMFLPYFTFFILLVCTGVLIRKLTSKSKWRQSTSNAASYKERKLFAMLITISLLFISCTIPQAALTTAIGIVRSLSTDRPLHYVYIFSYSFASVLETINCSSSMLVYYKMSSKYKKELQRMFPFLKQKKQENVNRVTLTK